MVIKFYLQYANTRIIQVSKQSSKNGILIFFQNSVSYWHRKGNEEIKHK